MNGQEAMLLVVVGMVWWFALYHQSLHILNTYKN